MAIRLIIRFLLMMVTVCMLGVAGFAVWAISLIPELPRIESIHELTLKVPLRIYTSDGLLISEYGEERRIPIRISSTPQLLRQAILAAEDDRFYAHDGVDFIGIIRAMLVNIKARGIEQGASTITMQVARNYFLTPDRTYIRKAKEALLAFQIERLLSKDEILELYVNKIFLGHRAYGFAAAARTYYGKTLDELTLAQYAMLAALPKAPSQINPLSNPDGARNRRNYVLDRMHELGRIDVGMHEQATESPLTAANHMVQAQFDAPYLAEHVRAEMVERFGDAAYENGYQVYMTIDSRLQRAAMESLRKGILAYDRRHGFRGPVRSWDLKQLQTDADKLAALRQIPSSKELIPALVLEVGEEAATAFTIDSQIVSVPWETMRWARAYRTSRSLGPKPKRPADVLAAGDMVHVAPEGEGWSLAQIPQVEGALVAISPQDGAVKAMQGGFDFFLGKFNRATQAKRQLGSNVKPFVYSAALERGYTAASRVSGNPVVVENQATALVWRPENYSGRFYGPTRLRQALNLSLNLVSVRLVKNMGVDFTADHVIKFGFDPQAIPRELSLALGAAEVTPSDVVSAYAVFANGGYAVEPYVIDFIKDRYGKVIARGQKMKVCSTCLEDDRDESSGPGSAESAGLVRQAPRVISSANAYILNSLLKDVVQAGTGRKAKALNRADLGGKTGTTNNFEDAWFSGFNDGMAATVWIGFDKPDDLGRHEAGSRAALPIWVEFMKTALEDVPENESAVPDNVVTALVHKETGEPVTDGDPDGYPEVFIAGTQPANAGDYGGAGAEPPADSSPDEGGDELF